MEQSVTDLAPSWSIAGTRGWSQLTCSAVAGSATRGTVLCSFDVEGDFWQRDRDLSVAILARDFRVILPQVIVDLSALQDLHDALVDWQVNKGDVQSELSSSADQGLSVSIGREADLIYSADKPACTIHYDSSPAMSAKWSFVVDQSCIRICSDGIREFIARVSSVSPVGPTDR